jgi:hypothetical protein
MSPSYSVPTKRSHLDWLIFKTLRFVPANGKPGYKIVSYPGKGECADPVNEDAIMEGEGGGESQDRNRERQLASDTGGGKT